MLRKLFIFLLVLGFSFASNVTNETDVTGLGANASLIVCECDIAPYLFLDEIVTDVVNFSLTGENGGQYCLVYVDDIRTFLIKEGELMLDADDVSEILGEYYTSLYYPDEDSIDELKTIFVEYNLSRNNGDFFKGVEEEKCAMTLLFHAFPCVDESTCFFTSTVLCDEYGDVFGCSTPSDIFEDVYEFGMATNGLTNSLNDIMQKLNSLNSDNVHDSLTEIKDEILNLLDMQEDLEKTIFRYPTGGDICSNCYAVCMAIDINESLMDDAEDSLDELLEKTSYLGDYDAVAENIASESNERSNLKDLQAEMKYYTLLLKPYEEKAEDVLPLAKALLETVDNQTVRNKVENVEELFDGVRESINTTEFTGINASLEEIGALLNVINNSIEPAWQIYNDTEKEQVRASSYMFALETSNVPEFDPETYDDLKKKKRTLDYSFVEGLTPERYLEIREDYVNITTTIIPLLSGVQIYTFEDQVKSQGKSLTEGVLGTVQSIQPLSREDRSELSFYLPLGLSIWFFISVSSLLFFIVILVSSFVEFFENKVAFVGAMLVALFLIIGVGFVSGGLYLLIDQSTNIATVNDFREEMLESEHITIFLDAQDVESATLDEMTNCAKLLSTTLTNKTVTIYQKYNEDKCIIESSGISTSCSSSIKEPIITFRYAEEEKPPTFSVVFKTEGIFEGDKDYFHSCDMGHYLLVSK
ncbi:hypothetical protein KAW38_02085 [Candidatus Micrarchaeota archaeon]|nr:hypothetical protein [Candidatus Micrarchaeota archaeon]